MPARGQCLRKYLDCVLCIICVELGSHGRSGRRGVGCQKWVVGCQRFGVRTDGSSIDLPFSPPPPTLTSCRSAVLPQLSLSHSPPQPPQPQPLPPHPFSFLNANLSDKCSPRHVIIPVCSYKRRRRGGQTLCRGSRDRKGFLRHRLQGIPLSQSQ